MEPYHDTNWWCIYPFHQEDAILLQKYPDRMGGVSRSFFRVMGSGVDVTLPNLTVSLQSVALSFPYVAAMSRYSPLRNHVAPGCCPIGRVSRAMLLLKGYRAAWAFAATLSPQSKMGLLGPKTGFWTRYLSIEEKLAFLGQNSGVLG